jgi:hypothetical protein
MKSPRENKTREKRAPRQGLEKSALFSGWFKGWERQLFFEPQNGS